MSLPQVRADLQRRVRRFLCQLEVPRRQTFWPGHRIEVELRFRESAIRQGEVRVALRSLFEQFDLPVQAFVRALSLGLIVNGLGLCIEGIGHWIGSRSFRDCGFFRRRELSLKLVGDLLRDLSLNRKYV